MVPENALLHSWQIKHEDPLLYSWRIKAEIPLYSGHIKHETPVTVF
jgi:hypothetical protein